jgi:hypothetical protein
MKTRFLSAVTTLTELPCLHILERAFTQTCSFRQPPIAFTLRADKSEIPRFFLRKSAEVDLQVANLEWTQEGVSPFPPPHHLIGQ